MVSSKDCIANIFYDFVYCLSSTSQCQQCISCYNDDIHGKLYIPIGTETSTAKECNDDICTNCKTNCKDMFNHKKYNQHINDNADTSSCPTLKSFVSEMNATTLSFTTNNPTKNSIYSYHCANSDTISIKYGIISTHSDQYNEDCTLDISHELITACNEQSSCIYDINNINNMLTNCGNTFILQVGAFCVSTHAETYRGNIFMDQQESNNNNSDTIFIVLITIIILLTLIIFIIFMIGLCKGWYSCHIILCCNKPVSDSQRTLNNKSKRSERAQSDTIDVDSPNNNIGGDSEYKQVNKTTTLVNVAELENPTYNESTYDSHIPSNNHSQQVISTSSYHTPTHNIHPQHNNQLQPQKGNIKHNRNIHSNKSLYNRNQYTNMMHHEPLPHTRRNINNTQPQDPNTMVVAFHSQNPNNIGASMTNLTRQSLSYDNRNIHSYGQHVVTTNDAHIRNTSVIVDTKFVQPTQTRNSPYGSFSSAHHHPNNNVINKQQYMNGVSTGAVDNNYDYGHSLKSHPGSILNRSDVIYPFQSTNPIMNGMTSDELQHTLMDMNGVRNGNGNNNHNNNTMVNEQKFHPNVNVDVDVYYWNQYYGINSGNNNGNGNNNNQNEYWNNNNNFNFNFGMQNNNTFIPDLMNPNGDVYDDTKIEVIGQVEIQLEAEIGKGCNSKVFKARWRNTEVAAKRFTVLDITKKKSKEYIDNYAIKVNKEPHENVIKTLAIANKPFTLLTEYMNKGSVKNYVRRSRPGSTSISILDRIEIALQAAKGIAHLHKLGIIHSEITSSNLLMELKINNHNNRRHTSGNRNRYNINDIRVVITDYAIQQMLSGDELETYRSSLGPLKWMAPELIENSGTKTTFESDIYAFGITMWEIITGQEPYPDVDPVDTAIYVCVKERRPQSYAFIPEKIQNLMKLCWHKNKQERPNAQKVVNMLTQFVQLERKQNNERDDLFE